MVLLLVPLSLVERKLLFSNFVLEKGMCVVIETNFPYITPLFLRVGALGSSMYGCSPIIGGFLASSLVVSYFIFLLLFSCYFELCASVFNQCA